MIHIKIETFSWIKYLHALTERYLSIMQTVNNPDRTGDVQLLVQVQLVPLAVRSKVSLEQGISVLMSVYVWVPFIESSTCLVIISQLKSNLL